MSQWNEDPASPWEPPAVVDATSDAAEMSPDDPTPSLRGSLWGGARKGVRWASILAAVLAFLPALFGVAITAFGLGSGRGFGVHKVVPGALMFFLLVTLYGGVLGVILGLVGHLFRKVRKGREVPRWWSALNRPLTRRQGGVPGRAGFLSRCWPWLVSVPAVLAVVGGYGLGFYLGRFVDRRLTEATAAADRDDPEWRIDDLLADREEVPHEENSAIIVAEALEELPEHWPAGGMPEPGKPRRPDSPAANALDRLSETSDPARLDDQTAQALRIELERQVRPLEIARTLVDYPRGRHEIDLGPTLYDTLLPETQASRTLARLLQADAAVRAQGGDVDGALDSCRALLNVGRSIGDEPTAISVLVRVAIGVTATRSVRRVLAQGQPSDSALERIQLLLLDELAQPLERQALRGERAMLVELIRRVGAGEVSLAALSDDRSKYASRDLPAPIAPWGRLMFDHQQAVALEIMNQAVAIASRPMPERPALWRSWEAQLAEIRQSPLAAYTSSLPVLMTPAVSSMDGAVCRYDAELGSTVLLVAAERHRRRNGSWPAAADRIEKAILPEAPEDPYAGRPFHLRLEEGQLRIYSVGPNGQDDEGEYDPRRWGRGGGDDVGGSLWSVTLRGQPAPGTPNRLDGESSAGTKSDERGQ